jgi:hypothetical protein
MRAGADIIYQAALRESCFIGHADFLRNVIGISQLCQIAIREKLNEEVFIARCRINSGRQLSYF